MNGVNAIKTARDIEIYSDTCDDYEGEGCSYWNKIRSEGAIVYRLEDGRIAEIWEISDLLSMYKGLDIIEYKKLPEDAKQS